MFKIKPERVAGVVALSYLVLIPVGAFVLHRRIQIVESDVDVLLANSDIPPSDPTPPIFDVPALKRIFAPRYSA